MANVLIAGGATGIGLAALRAFRQRGDSVLLADIDFEAANAAVREEGVGRAAAMHCDLAVPANVLEAVAAAVDFGAGELDVVFSSAGLLRVAPLEDWSLDDWDRTIAVNLRAPFLLAQASAPHLKKSSIASMIFTSSTGAYRGTAGAFAYSASKAGLVNLVRALADELSPTGVRANCLCPGWVDTPFNDSFWSQQDDQIAARTALEARIPMRRQGTPEDMVGAILYLGSDSSAYMTGQSIILDGGYSAV
ncbi:SDR family NAD(P)-dependent oxidoreductase [Homoserinimonas sp. OAct 916]|uniref:SDR family NAD(P)-dependent oxidoreductase n=1 Tax=Homoserinimonas sp. OAct 916 TaxID=2211450 RepID=UPI000DBE256C|nr:SDR family oxidoreductase [Homoserinimonas sp. OAct 916]